MKTAATHLLGLIAIVVFSTAARAQEVSYDVAFPNAVHHEAQVEVVFEGVPLGQSLEVRMSRTSPGRYALHEFAKNVYGVQASDGEGRALTVTRPNPHQWDIGGHDGTVRVRYTLFGDRADGTYTAIDETHGHLNMPATFMWARGFEEVPITITFHQPDPDWTIATQLYPTDVETVFTAPSLAYFIDSPTELGRHALRTWEVTANGRTVLIRLAVHHAGTDDALDDFADTARKVVAEEIAVFGEVPVYETGTYTFIADYLPWVSSDGMEHRNSTVLTNRNPLTRNNLDHLYALSHEFFHSWNVERIRPATLEPFDLEAANMSGELWFAEGFTNYYMPLFVRRAGLIDDRAYAATLSDALDTVINSPGRRYFSPVEMSMQAPFVDAATSVDPQNRNNTFISYYTWGSAIGLGLDLTLRTRFDSSLDAYMQAMWIEYGRSERPYTLADLERVLAETVNDAAFATDFFQRYVEGSETMDYRDLLAQVGFVLRRARPGLPWLGAQIRNEGGQVVVAGRPMIGSPLYQAGLEVGAILLQVDGRPVGDAGAFNGVIDSVRPEDRLLLDYELRGEIRQTTLVLTEDPALEVVPYESAGRSLSGTMRALRRSWLGSRAAASSAR